MKLQEVLDKTVRFFKEKNFESPRLDAELLIAKAMGFRRIDLYLKFDQPLKDEEVGKCREAVRRRSLGEPVAYILGQKEFYGISFEVDSRVLIPRPETELLAEEALAYLKSRPEATEPLQLMDLGSGSGCLGLTLLSKISESRAVLVDLSNDALEVARKNAEQLGLSGRTHFVNADAAKVSADVHFDLIIANPPYIDRQDTRVAADVLKFEPHQALFAEDDGFAMIRLWSENAVSLLKPGGWIGFEIGMDQGAKALEHFESLGLQNVRIVKDLSGLDRHVVGIRPREN